MAKPLVLVLTDSQRLELERMRDTHPLPYFRERAAALLKVADGQSARQVAEHGLLKQRYHETVAEWVKRYQAKGLAGLAIKPGRGRKPAFSPKYADAESAREAVLHVVQRAPHHYGEKGNRWTLDSLRRACDWLQLTTASGLSHPLKRPKISYKRAREHVHSPDDNYLAKLSDVRVLARRSETDSKSTVVLFQDELTFYRRPTLSWAYEQAGRCQPLAEQGYRPNLAWRVAAALDIWTGRVIYHQDSRIGVKALVDFYQKVCAAYPQAQTIYLVQDNWPIHVHPDVLAALQPQRLKWPVHTPKYWPTEPSANARRLNLPIQLVQLPTYASWTNPIEKLWRKLKQEELHLHRFQDDWDGLKQHVAQWLDQFATGSPELLRYVGLSDPARLYRSAFARVGQPPP